MRVNVLYFGTLKDLFASEREPIDLPDGATVDSLLSLLRAQTSKQSDVWRALAVAVNQEYAALSTTLREGDEVALLPPVSGGAPSRCEV
ncbi:MULTISPECIES: molybdopterin converting factor subunit 1 [Acidobacteriaceae]|uniref:molybdopterin converting factor subunit 1 n=1 Tax=Acidobacteriaceae TaxID=204434 RepID=UPI00131D15EA|nr:MULTISPECIES: molybdopterin converting factor subunit 1 [Acidobacteriaceae]MDW5264439.1 molybdopterin converting factor subunit 1 [Edaphobacter sp.]